MLIGVPREIKNHEYRVAITPSGVKEFTNHGHSVLIESGAGLGSAITDDAYVAAGAEIVTTADEVWQRAEMILKVWGNSTQVVLDIYEAESVAISKQFSDVQDVGVLKSSFMAA